MKLIGNQIKRDIDALINFASTKKPLQMYDIKFYECYFNNCIRVTPVFQWAQNRDHIVMQIKFAHRFDSPGIRKKV